MGECTVVQIRKIKDIKSGLPFFMRVQAVCLAFLF